MEKIVFATKNQGKIREIKLIMQDMPFEIVSMEDIGIDIDIDETGKTFEENAIIKAKAVMKKCGLITLADDSGLEVDFLDKAPGVYSARYMGENTPYDIKNKKIIELLNEVPYEKRTARFVSVIAAVLKDKNILTARGVIEGVISYEQKGKNGFGYDPIFYIPQYQKTAAELSIEQKNEISHRGKALNLMKEELKKHLGGF